MLTLLRNIRSAMVASDEGAMTSAAQSEAHRKKVESLEEENERLRNMNTKQRYRIDHLIKGMLELQGKLEEKNN